MWIYAPKHLHNVLNKACLWAAPNCRWINLAVSDYKFYSGDGSLIYQVCMCPILDRKLLILCDNETSHYTLKRSLQILTAIFNCYKILSRLLPELIFSKITSTLVTKNSTRWRTWRWCFVLIPIFVSGHNEKFRLLTISYHWATINLTFFVSDNIFPIQMWQVTGLDSPAVIHSPVLVAILSSTSALGLDSITWNARDRTVKSRPSNPMMTSFWFFPPVFRFLNRYCQLFKGMFITTRFLLMMFFGLSFGLPVLRDPSLSWKCRGYICC